MRKLLLVLSLAAVLSAGCRIDDDRKQSYVDLPLTVSVDADTGAVQCEDDGLSVAETAHRNAGIDVLSSSCGHILAGPAAVCGAGTSGIQIHEIPAANANDAEALRFGLLEKLMDEDGAPNYQEVECETEA